ncbi:MAG: hypothetical protein IPM21_01485 [Acidobacteria bacterium]|nr:hypothetical protein [Acidobacteriota bacterium]
MTSLITKSNLLLSVIGSLIFFHFAVSAAPNTANYTFTTATNGSLTNMANSEQLIRRSTISTTTTVVHPIGFDFYFMGEYQGNTVPMRYSHFSVTTKGFLGLGTQPVNGNFAQALGVDLGMPVIAPFAGNLRTSASGAVRFRTVGNAPERVLVVQWANMSSFASGTSVDMTFEARLYETTGVIEFVYGSMNQTIATSTGQIGFASGLDSGEIGRVIAPQSGTPEPTFDATSTGTGGNTYAIGPISVLTSASTTSRRVFRFTPNAPSAPSDVGFANVTATSLTINWSDNSTNETGFAVYLREDLPAERKSREGPEEFQPELEDLRETLVDHVAEDEQSLHRARGFETLPVIEKAITVTKRWRDPEASGPFELEGFQSATAVGEGATSAVITGLKPNTAYSFRVVALTEGAVGPAAAGDQATIAAGIVLATSSGGNWSDPATWQGNAVPSENDRVEIPVGTTVVIDQIGLQANDVVVFGVLEFTSIQNASLTARSIMVENGSIFRASVTGTNIYTLNLNGDLINNGTLDFSNNSNTAGVNLIFRGKEDANFGGTGAVTNVFRITMDSKGFDGLPRTVTLDPQNFSVKGQTVESSTGFLELLTGVLKISGTFTGTHRVFSNDVFGFLLPVDTGLWIDNPNFTFAAASPQIRDGGSLRVSAGTVVLQSLMIIRDLVVEGGQIDTISPINVSNFAQSGGTITTGKGTCSGTAFLVIGKYETTGGTVVLQASPTGCGSTNVIFDNLGAAFNSTGGTVQTGNAASGAAKTFTVTGTVYDLVTNGTSANHLTNATDLSTRGNTLIEANTRLTALRFNQIGPLFTNNGTLNSTADATVSAFNFSGTGPQTYTGTGTGGTLTTPLQTLGISNVNNVTIDPSSPQVVTSRINLFSGTLINSDKILIGGGTAAGLRLVQRGNANTQTAPPGEFDTSPTFSLGTSGLQLIYANAGTNIPTGFEVPSSRVISRLLFLCPNGLLLTGGDLTIENVSPVGRLEISSGVFSTGANTLILGATTTVTRTGGHIDGDLRMIYTAAGSKTFHTGTSDSYSPVTANVTALGVNPSSLTIRSNAGAHPNVPNAPSALRRFWSITELGELTANLSFVYQESDLPNGIPETSLDLKRYTGSGDIFDTILATLDTTSNTITTTSPVSDFSDWTLFSTLAPTSANVSIGGRVLANGRGIAFATVAATDAEGTVRTALSNQFGYYKLEDLAAGENYIVSVRHKRFSFLPRVVFATEDISDLTLESESGQK